MRKKIIIHISDLHVTSYKGNDGRVTNDIKSYLTTNIDGEASDAYTSRFIDKIKKEFSDSEFILLITGDVSNKAEKSEFIFAKKFISKIIAELAIETKNVLLLPGDHDVHRRSIENALEDSPNDEPYLLNEVKFSNFSTLYKEVKQADFPFDKVIVDSLIIEDKIVLIGINSNYKIDHHGGKGYLPIDIFTNELENLKSNLNGDNYQFVVCWHHNFTSGYENSNSGQWDSANRQSVLPELERQNIKLVLTGNEHTNNSKQIFAGSIHTSDCGVFSSTNSDSTFKVYSVEIGETISFGNKSFALQTPNGNDLKYFWDERSNEESKQIDQFILFEKNKQNIDDVVELPEIPAAELDTEYLEQSVTVDERYFFDDPAIANELYAIIKQKGLFHSGHFHWSDSSRAHNWIDVSKLLEDNHALYFAQNAIIAIMDSFNLAENCNLIVGLGYEGSILSSKASIKFDIPYTALPYSYRYNDHHDYEKRLNYDNSNNKYETVVVITDVVNDGRTIRKLIGDHEKEFFQNVKRIIVMSLFYTGHNKINKDILNFDKLTERFDKKDDCEVNNIEFYTVKTLRVEKCPYGSNYKEECFILRDGLDCVHSFYTE